MLKILYIMVAIVCAVLALALVGYGIAHGGNFFYLVIPLVLAIFALPLWLDKWLKAKSPRLAALAYAVPLMGLAGPLVFLFLFNPWYEERVGTAVLNAIKVAVVDETPIKNRNGHLIGVKITYTYELPETVAYGGVAKKLLMFTRFPTPQLRSSVSPQEMVDLNNGFDIFYQNGRRVPASVGIKSGKYTVESWRMSSLIKMQKDGFCKSKPYAGQPESMIKAGERALNFPRQPFTLDMRIWVSKSFRMGGFEHDFRPAYTTKNEFDGPGLRKAAEELPPCDTETDKNYISPPKDILDHLQDFVSS
jgi:hypothetical protein